MYYFFDLIHVCCLKNWSIKDFVAKHIQLSQERLNTTTYLNILNIPDMAESPTFLDVQRHHSLVLHKYHDHNIETIKNMCV